MAALVLPCEFLFCSGEGGIWELLAAAGDGHATHRKRDLGRKAAASTTVVSEPAAQTASQSSYKGWYSFKLTYSNSLPEVVSPRTQEEVPLYPTEILKGLYTWLQPLPATV
ncbi:hypothetical protein HJG60_008229 [Phyllostomus discolor]|uniref:Uncharacterized protein n=1 Tax=Phyllostomus discolor TaxID=89673 RepID=A0A833Z6Q4_9CHIR|nr:hypothetical protein HJG60_008229 [Phyllostomus discolor]